MQDVVQYPDEEVEVFEYEDNVVGFDTDAMLKKMLDFGNSNEYTNAPLFDHSDKLLQSVPKIDTEQKIRQMLEW